jgi:hypothetical protein
MVGPRQTAKVDCRPGARQLPDPEVSFSLIEKAAPLKRCGFFCLRTAPTRPGLLKATGSAEFRQHSRRD